MAAKTYPKTKLAISLFSLVLFVSTTAHSKIIYVDDDGPADFDNIQAAIDDASHGDIIIVNPGTYTGQGNRDIDFVGKAISVRSENGPENCIIDCQSAGRGFHFHSGEDANSVLSGFTITNGYSAIQNGGGIYCINSSPTLTNCIFIGNSAEDGGGLYNRNSGSLLNNCKFTGNSANFYAGGMYNDDSSPTLTNCTFSGNCAQEDGAGMCNWESSPTLSNCTFSGNTAYERGGGMANFRGSPTLMSCTFNSNSAGRGGGMDNRESRPTLIKCMFSGNSAYWGGGGMYNSGSSPMLTNCTFSGNSVAYYGGGGMNNYGSDPTVTNCKFSENSAAYGGGMSNYQSSNPTVKNCTFTGNSALGGNAVACNSYLQQYPSNIQISNCILWNGGDEIWNNDGSTITMTYSDVQEDWPGEGNINADPCFVDAVNGDYHLLTSSLCIDAGDPNYVPEPNETDIDGKPRVLDGNNDGIAVVDMGAYELGPRYWYVDDDASNDPEPGNPDVSDPMEDGTQAHPFDVIQEAIDAAASGDTVLVAPGVYNEYVIMKDGVNLQGAGAEVTMIDGRYTMAVVTGANNCRLDGFTITGYAHEDIDGVSCRDVEDFTISHNIIKNNTWSGIWAIRSSVVVSNNLVLNNICAGVWVWGDRESSVPSVIINNTICGNRNQAGINIWDGAAAVVVNNIITGNTGSGGVFCESGGTVTLVKNNVWGNTCWYLPDADYVGCEPGETDISVDPLFVDPMNENYRLQRGSPCIDAGDPNYIPEPNETDLDGKPRVLDGNNDGIAVVDMGAYELGPRYWYVDDDASNDPGPGDPSVSDPIEDGTQIHPFDVIQEAIDAAASGDTVLVAPGVYNEYVIMKDGVNLQGAGAEVTMIDGRYTTAVVTGANNCRLDGFTIIGDAHDDIDGVRCQDIQDFVISHNIIKNNTWSGIYALRSSVVVSNNLILNNVCAGILCDHESPAETVIINNTICGNHNEAGINIWHGVSAFVANNIITSNTGYGGIFCAMGGTVRLVSNNVWGNTCWGLPDADYVGCEPGETDISVDPLFVDPVNENYHLESESACIDAGDPNYIAEPNETDLDGKPRIIGCRIDMGAFEYGQLVPAEVKIVPRTINLSSKGKWISCSISLPEDYNVVDIDSDSILLECEIEPESLHVDELAQLATARFSREDVQPILEVGDIELRITGRLTDGTVFEGTDSIRVINKNSLKSAN